MFDPVTKTGFFEETAEPSPSSPQVFFPQHWIDPPEIRAQVWLPPADTAVTVPASPETETGREEFVRELFPNWPSELSPQHWTDPPEMIAQLWLPPAERAVTIPASPETETGSAESLKELFPSWPLEFEPQHWTEPPEMSAQLWFVPDAMAVAAPNPAIATGRVEKTEVDVGMAS